MAHKYLNKLGVASDDTCVFNTENDRDWRMKRFRKERKKHGFDARETWSMDYTSATWLYEHLKVFKKIANIDFSFNKCEIPVLHERVPREGEAIPDGEPRPPRKYYDEVMEEHTLGEAIDIMVDYLKRYILCSESKREFQDLMESRTRGRESLRCAFLIYANVINEMWW